MTTKRKKSDVVVPAYPGGAYRYRHDGRGWLVYAEGHDDNHFRGSLVSCGGDVLWMTARFAECLDALAAHPESKDAA